VRHRNNVTLVSMVIVHIYDTGQARSKFSSYARLLSLISWKSFVNVIGGSLHCQLKADININMYVILILKKKKINWFLVR